MTRAHTHTSSIITPNLSLSQQFHETYIGFLILQATLPIFSSCSIAGFMSMVKKYGPSNSDTQFTSKDLQNIFTGKTSHQGSLRKFCPKDEVENRMYYSTEKPDIAVSYPWGMDLRKHMPIFLDNLFQRLLLRREVSSRDEFENRTIWVDIFFNDQNSKEITHDLNEAQEIYEKARLHVVFLMYDPLSRGWCLFEVGVRVWSILKEFSVDLEQIPMVVGGISRDELKFRSRRDWQQYPASDVASKFPEFILCEGLTNVECDVKRFSLFVIFEKLFLSSLSMPE